MPSIACCPSGLPSKLNFEMHATGGGNEFCLNLSTSFVLNGQGGSVYSGSGGGVQVEFQCIGLNPDGRPIGHLHVAMFEGCDDVTIEGIGEAGLCVMQAFIWTGSEIVSGDCCDGGQPTRVQFNVWQGLTPVSTRLPKKADPCNLLPPAQRPGCRCNCGGQCSTNPIRYATGEVEYVVNDLESSGYGASWGHTRSFANRLSASETIGNGFNWLIQEWPALVMDPWSEDVSIQERALSPLWFRKAEDKFEGLFGIRQRLEYDAIASCYRLTDLDGTITEFNATSRMFRSRTDPAGNSIEVVSLASNALNPSEVQRHVTQDGVLVTESFLYQYGTATGDTLLSTLTLRRRENAGAWSNVVRARYEYYGPFETHGSEGDFKTVIREEWNGATWTETGASQYRYYIHSAASSSSSSSSSSSGTSGLPFLPIPPHLLKYALDPSSYARMIADGHDPDVVSDAVFSQYADYYFEYDGQRRVTLEMVQGGSRSFAFDYVESGFAEGENSWSTKTVETRPDGSQFVVYSNSDGLKMLTVLKSGADEWCEFFRYSDRRVVLHAGPSAISGYDESKPDLLDEIDGNFLYLRDHEGPIRRFSWHAPSGFISGETIQQGELGCCIKLRDLEYVSCTCGSSSSSSAGSGFGSSQASSSSSSSSIAPLDRRLWFLSRMTVYPDDGGCGCSSSSSGSSSSSSCAPCTGYRNDGTRTIVTDYAYTWYSSTCAVQEKVTTLPAIPTDQNGSGVAATRREYFDTYGNLTWQMDERGYLTRMTYDIPTGALTQRIDDVDTALVSDAPAGWTTPGGGGLHLITDFEHDDRGRITQSLGPVHTIDVDGAATPVRSASWMVYEESSTLDTVRTARGYQVQPASSSSSSGSGGPTPPAPGDYLVNPVSISITDKKGMLLEQIQTVRGGTHASAPVVSAGKLLPSDSFPQSSYVRWTTNQYTDCCLAASVRVYHTIPSSGEGASGTNYDETDYGYDVMKRRNRTVTLGGTITDLVFDPRGLTLQSWVGTNDDGATDSDPSGGGLDPHNNMVLATTSVYDEGQPGGDGKLTQQSQHVDASTTRTTSFLYDWRNRQTAVDGEIDFYEQRCYDNLDRLLRTDRRHTTASGNLVARSETLYDDQSRVFRTIRYAVDPATGAVGNSLVDNTWYDASGNTLKSLPSGSRLFTKTVYDSLGRATTRYTGFSTAACGVAVCPDHDVILEQSETTYDDVSNVLQSTSRQRYHNAPATQTGPLQDPSTNPKARVTFSAM